MRVDYDFTFLGPGQLPHDVEPEANAAEPAPIAGVTLHEPLEHSLTVFFQYADSFVLHIDDDHFAVAAGQYGNDAPFGGVLDRILQKLPDDDVGGHRISIRLRQLVGHVNLEFVQV